MLLFHLDTPTRKLRKAEQQKDTTPISSQNVQYYENLLFFLPVAPVGKLVAQN